jgi:flagellar biosynthesis anti-sigma factor FlgM
VTSRIDGNPDAPIATRFDRTESGQSAERAQSQTKTAEADRVELFPDAPPIDSALPAPQAVPPVRSGKVEAAKRALADGTLGADAGKLADALIDTMLDEKKR